MGLWEALQQLGELREYEAALLADAGQAGQLDPDMPLLEHAFQTAEICRWGQHAAAGPVCLPCAAACPAAWPCAGHGHVLLRSRSAVSLVSLDMHA